MHPSALEMHNPCYWEILARWFPQYIPLLCGVWNRIQCIAKLHGEQLNTLYCDAVASHFHGGLSQVGWGREGRGRDLDYRFRGEAMSGHALHHLAWCPIAIGQKLIQNDQ